VVCGGLLIYCCPLFRNGYRTQATTSLHETVTVGSGAMMRAGFRILLPLIDFWSRVTLYALKGKT